jgi:hypothetical protein
MAIILANKVKKPDEATYYLDEDWDFNGFYYAGYGTLLLVFLSVLLDPVVQLLMRKILPFSSRF